jgi:CheY-like chemotaxis protein
LARTDFTRCPLRSIPIIAVTSYALDGEEKIAKAAGCDDYVPKPHSPRELLAKIRQHLSWTADYLLQCMSLVLALSCRAGR